jgi:hypothetical protein
VTRDDLRRRMFSALKTTWCGVLVSLLLLRVVGGTGFANLKRVLVVVAGLVGLWAEG